MHIGLIVGIGPAATDYYYRYLITALARAGHDLTLTMAHADTPTLLRNQASGNVDAQVQIYKSLTERLQHAGIEQIAVTSIAGHFCIDAFKSQSPVPVIDLLDVVKAKIAQRGLKKVGLMGTRVVMESQFYGVLAGVEVIPPVENLAEVHDAYVAMAAGGTATPEHCEVFIRTGQTLVNTYGCESVMLAGTDLALVFKKGQNFGFETFDCAVKPTQRPLLKQRWQPLVRFRWMPASTTRPLHTECSCGRGAVNAAPRRRDRPCKWHVFQRP